ncbi:MAG: hypothetical protein DRO12_05085 [Thermoprotei archaeon]|nr:MAG: hypothetical protein DRO12_05085 [Thermoprotei archaeon]
MREMRKMVTCKYCGKTLPFECTCSDSREEKILRYLDSAIWELEMIKRWIESGIEPNVRVYCGGVPLEEIAEVDSECRLLDSENSVTLAVTVRGKLKIPYDGEVEIVTYRPDGEVLYVDRKRVTIPRDSVLNCRVVLSTSSV